MDRSLRRTVALLHEEPAVRTVIILTSLLTVVLGVLQVLFTPMLLPRFAVGQVGTAQSVAACGLLVGAAIVGGLGRVAPWMMLSAGLTLVGAGMVGLPLSDSPPALTACAFLVFAALACCNTGAEIDRRTSRWGRPAAGSRRGRPSAGPPRPWTGARSRRPREAPP